MHEKVTISAALAAVASAGLPVVTRGAWLRCPQRGHSSGRMRFARSSPWLFSWFMAVPIRQSEPRAGAPL